MFNFIYFLFEFIARNFVRWVRNPGFYASLFLLFVSTAVFLFSGNQYKRILTAQHFYKETVCTINADKSYQEELEKDCEVTQVDVITNKKTSTPCVPRLCSLYEVKYTVNNQNYLALGRYNTETDYCNNAEFVVGQKYFCWYNPKDPNIVLLDRGQSTLLPVIMMWCLLLMAWLGYKNFISPSSIKDTTIKPTYRKPDFFSDLVSIVLNFFFGGLFALLFVLLVLAIIFPFLYLPYKTFNYWRYHHRYVSSICKVVDKKPYGTPNIAGGNHYLPFLLLQYPVKDIQYFTWTSPTSVYSDKTQQEKVLQQYPINQQYNCWYDPDQPREVILNRNFFYNLFH